MYIIRLEKFTSYIIINHLNSISTNERAPEIEQ